jgi:hypothetical protein
MVENARVITVISFLWETKGTPNKIIIIRRRR